MKTIITDEHTIIHGSVFGIKIWDSNECSSGKMCQLQFRLDDTDPAEFQPIGPPVDIYWMFELTQVLTHQEFVSDVAKAVDYISRQMSVAKEVLNEDQGSV